MTRFKSILTYLITFLVCLVVLTITLDTLPNIWALVISIIVTFMTYYILKKTLTSKNDSQNLPKLSKEKKEFYQSKGLSPEDIKFFRQTMMTTKSHILAIENQLNASNKLRAIEKRNNTIEICKAMFKDIVKDPDRLHQVDQFLYIHLPSLNDISHKHVNIEAHKAKSKVTYDILRKSSDTIDDLCQQITQDYLAFKDKDLSTIKTSIDITEHTIGDNDTNYQLDDSEI